MQDQSKKMNLKDLKSCLLIDSKNVDLEKVIKQLRGFV
jgi:hypothetical protein